MKSIIITGASEGLGASLTRLFASNNWNVIGIARHKSTELPCTWIEGDLTTEAGLSLISQTIISQYPVFDCLVNCAGKLSIKKLSEVPLKETEELFRLNMLAPLMLVSALKERILQNNADIVNVGSTIGYKAYEDQAAYGTSKWGLRGLSENLRLEFKGTSTRVIHFSPGGFKSKIFEKATGVAPDLSPFMNPDTLAEIVYLAVSLPKSVEISEMIVNRK